MIDLIIALVIGFGGGVLVGWYSFRNSKKVQDVAEALDEKYTEVKDKASEKVSEVVSKAKASSTKKTTTKAKSTK